MAALTTVRLRPSTFRDVLVTCVGLASLPGALVCIISLSPGAVAAMVLPGSLYYWLARQARLRHRGEIELETEGIVVRSEGIENRLTRDDVEGGYEVPRRGLFLHLRNGSTLEATFEDASVPSKVLNHFGLTLDQRALSAPLRGVLGGFTRGLITFFVTTLSTLFATAWMPHGILVSLVLTTIATVLVVRRLRPSVVVGLDGVRIAGVMFPKFIPYSAIAMVHGVSLGQMGEAGIALMGTFGTRVLPTIGQSKERMQALIERIEVGRRRYSKEGVRPLELLDRGGRSIDQWKQAVRNVRVGGFRDAALDLDELEQVLADPHSPLERRVGAALALHEVDDGRKRIRLAASTSADPRVRVALETAGEDEIDEEELLRSIAEE